MLIFQIKFFCYLFLFLFSFSFFYFFNIKDGVTPLYVAAQKGDEQIVQILLEKGNPNVDLPTLVLLLILSFSSFSSFFIFLFFFNVKDGRTPLYIAVQNGHEQIVQILLEKGKPNVDLPDKVLLLIVSFSFFYQFLIFLFFFKM